MASSVLGPLSSKLSGSERGRHDFYISIEDQLDTLETITGTPTVTSLNANVTVDNVAANVAAIEDTDRTVPIGKAIQFRATTTKEINGIVDLEAHWATTEGNYDTATVQLRIFDTVT